MLLCLPGVLSKEQVAACRRIAESADWIDGNATAGQQSALAKHNMQLREDSPEAKQLGDLVLDALAGNQLFISAALPLKIFPPLFNRYQGGESFGTHVDNAIRAVRGTAFRVRTDLSATLFLSEPEAYDGGELTIESAFGAQEVKLPACDMVLYPASSLHHVKPVTRGARLASFFWLQSMVRDDGQRTLLFDLDTAIQRLTLDVPEHPAALQLTAVYHNLLRRWADA
ncbi:MAG TPA: Fe2+-dependent dioxygenase [Vineibacter sp.]|nr:Fe2+-dependent dioxygenase [Vineibacter sp.]